MEKQTFFSWKEIRSTITKLREQIMIRPEKKLILNYSKQENTGLIKEKTIYGLITCMETSDKAPGITT